jgi:Dynamin family
VSTSFNNQFDEHGVWRREFAQRVKVLSDWMANHELLDPAAQERLQRVENLVRLDKVMVAFVAEFSRGKSELINAIFFAEYGRRLMPASAGRTTMCPTELAYDADIPPCLRLLPIETRLQPQSLMEWRMAPEKWERLDLDLNDAAQMATAFEKVAEVRHVSVDEAKALGFWHDAAPEDNPPMRADGTVEVPRWRHALINIAHPLLRQGLVILDTPGLNAIGAEPELTVSLIPQAHAVIFILGADTGVTKSDLAIWREHLITEGNPADCRYVVLNKIDTLWDALSTAEQTRKQIESQRVSSAEILGLPTDHVIPVSAQKGLVAKVTGDDKLLQDSRLLDLELALASKLLAQRQSLLRATVANSMSELRSEATRALHVRRRDLAEQTLELRGLRGKSSSMVQHMHRRISTERAEFDASGTRIHAVRSVHLKLLKDVYDLLGGSSLRAELKQLSEVLRQPGLKLGAKRAYMQTFERLRSGLAQAQQTSSEIASMLHTSFKQLNSEYGFSLQAPRAPDLSRYERDLANVERSHLQYLGLGNTLRLTQSDFTDRLVRALATRLRVVYESAQSDVEVWNKSAAAQLDAQLRDRRRKFTHRIEAVERIQEAADSLDERLADVESQTTELNAVDARLIELTEQLMAMPQQNAAAQAAPQDNAALA